MGDLNWFNVNEQLPRDGEFVEIEYWGDCRDEALYEKHRHGVNNAFTTMAFAPYKACPDCGHVDFFAKGTPYRKLVNPDRWRPLIDDGAEEHWERVR